MTGTTLGQYQLLEKVGSGGMGDVYKARDSRLNRLVAIKVLPPDKIANPDRKRRFIQEAQAASALQHPNIVVIYDINTENGVDYMAMEFIAGKTLDAIIPRQGMRLSEALKIAIPIADGLAKAHSAGIIHRDVKPSNIMVADDSRVKILDFGLAKLTESDSSNIDDATRPASPKTEDGAILGTVCYMSPEQAEAKKIDARSDIFSFGSLLYEMLTGRKAFQASSLVATLSAILKEEPTPVENLPTEMDRILRRCLRKDPARRFQSMADLKVALDEAREESESGKLVTPSVSAPPTKNRILPIAFAALLVAALAGAGWFLTRPKAAPELRLRQLTADSGRSGTPAISPDGKLVAYASDRAGEGNLDIWIQPLTDGARAIRLTKDPADEMVPSFSPDGSQIVFQSQRGGGGIYVVPALGGEERLLARGGHMPQFSPDGKSIAYITGINNLADSKAFVIPLAGGTPRRLGADIPQVYFPAWSPDGKYLQVVGQDDVGDQRSQDFWLVPIDGGKSIRTGAKALFEEQKMQFPLIRDWRGESIVFAERSAVWALDVSPATGKVGNLRKLTAGTSTLAFATGTPSQFVFNATAEGSHLWTLPLDLNTGKVTGKLSPLPHSGGNQLDPSSSADGKVLAYDQRNAGGNELRVRDIATGRESVLLTERTRPRVSPDGSKIAYSTGSSPAQGDGIYLMDAAGGQARKLVSFQKGGRIYNWTADGQSLVYYRIAPIRFFMYNLRSGKEHEIITHPTMDIHGVEPSPDMKWVVFHLPSSDDTPVKIAPLRDGRAAGEAEWITIAQFPGRNNRPWWSPDGNLLYFISQKDGYTDIWAQRLDPMSKRPVGDAFTVYHFHDARMNLLNAGSYGPAVGGNQITVALQERTGNIWIAERMP